MSTGIGLGPELTSLPRFYEAPWHFLTLHLKGDCQIVLICKSWHNSFMFLLRTSLFLQHFICVCICASLKFFAHNSNQQTKAINKIGLSTDGHFLFGNNYRIKKKSLNPTKLCNAHYWNFLSIILFSSPGVYLYTPWLWLSSYKNPKLSHSLYTPVGSIIIWMNPKSWEI